MTGDGAIPSQDEQFSTLREALQFYLIDCKTLPGKLIDVFIIALNLTVCAILVLETYPVPDTFRSGLWGVEVVTVLFFIIEYLARLYGARSRRRYLVNIYSIIDLVAIVPTLLLLLFPGAGAHIGLVRIIRVFRVFRIFRFLRFTADPHFFFATISLHLLRVVRLLLTILIIFFVSAGLLYQVENQYNPGITTFGDAFYFTIVTLTTVGFGDIVPVTGPGRWVTVLSIISGIILIPWQAGMLIREWIQLSTKTEVVCSRCGLRYHDPDASHCKACGNVIYQLYDGG